MAKVSLRAYNREIETMVDRGQLDEAIAHCRHILQTYPKHLDTYRLLGKAYLESKRNTDTADILSRVLVVAPNDFVANVGLSIIRDEENRLEDAIWHMERAFETQPSNPAIQAELQRLYARRDGVRPPRIRMTRGALAHMYVQGELYPQAISEIKSVLKDDPDRADMQALLARACYKSGLKNEAADVATALLRRYPYSLDANRVLIEILGSEHPETTQVYRQRVFELDPYAALVTGSVFLASEVSDAAVNIERLDWNGQPVAMQPDWSESKAISLESVQESDWLNKPLDEPSISGGIQSAPQAIFGSTSPPEPPPAQPADDIPDFLRAAGWGAATGAFDERKSLFGVEDSKSGEPIEQGELPDWVQAMKPVESEAATPSKEEEIPDWITNLGAGAISIPTGDQPEWLDTTGQPSEAGKTDWLSAVEGESQVTSAGEPEWLKEGLGDTGAIVAEPQEPDELDWLKNLGPHEEAPAAPQEEELDWLKNLGEPETAPAETQADELDWLKGLGAPETERSRAEEEQPDWLKGIAFASGVGAVSHLVQDKEPEEKMEAASETAPSSSEQDFLGQLSEEPILESPPEAVPPSADLNKLGTTEQEQDDSFAWLESLAAKQGATEGLLTKPEERLEEEPDWIKQAKGLTTPAEQPPASLEELGKSEQEQDDSFAWLESLAARQGATEGLLTQPEERLEEEPEWVKQAKDLSTHATPPAGTLEPEQPVVVSEPVPGVEAEQPPAEDDVEAWLKNLEGEEKTSEPAAAADETAVWLRGLEEREPSQAEPVEAEKSDLPDWMKSLQEGPAEEPTSVFAEEAELGSTWMPPTEEPAPVVESKAEQDALPSWLSDLDQEEEQVATPTDTEGLPAWLMAEETAPGIPEPTTFSDWKPMEETREPVAEPPEPATIPSVSLEMPEAETVLEPEQPRAEPEPAPVLETPQPETTPRRETGVVAIPTVDPVLGMARNELSRNNIRGALDSYGKLIKKARFLDEVIYDLREALYRYPVDVNIWELLGDAYMRANRLQDALDAYTKAEELLR